MTSHTCSYCFVNTFYTRSIDIRIFHWHLSMHFSQKEKYQLKIIRNIHDVRVSFPRFISICIYVGTLTAT